MKKRGIINARLSGYIAALGHMDFFMIGDAGMPIPKGVPVVDLALCEGVPTFEQVLKAVLDEVKVEGYFIAEEIADKNERIYGLIKKSLPDAEEEMRTHIQLKLFSEKAKFAIRTGEFSPYANIILRAGVVF